jgi:four helix bundle protein
MNFRKLDVWERAHMLAQSVYSLTDEHPGLVRYGLASQMQHAGADIASNIARGCGSSGNDGAQRWYFNAAMGSAASLEYLVLLTFELGLIPDDEQEWFTTMAVDVQKMLGAMLDEEAVEERASASLAIVQ